MPAGAFVQASSTGRFVFVQDAQRIRATETEDRLLFQRTFLILTDVFNELNEVCQAVFERAVEFCQVDALVFVNQDVPKTRHPFNLFGEFLRNHPVPAQFDDDLHIIFPIVLDLGSQEVSPDIQKVLNEDLQPSLDDPYQAQVLLEFFKRDPLIPAQVGQGFFHGLNMLFDDSVIWHRQTTLLRSSPACASV